MQPFFSTEDVQPKTAFRRWRELVCERLAPAALQADDADLFKGKLEVDRIGSVPISNLASTRLRTEATADMIRQSRGDTRVYAILRFSGNAC